MGIFDTSFLNWKEPEKDNVVVEGDPELTALFNFDNEAPIKKNTIPVPQVNPRTVPQPTQNQFSPMAEDNFENEEDFDNFLNTDLGGLDLEKPISQPTQSVPTPTPVIETRQEVVQQEAPVNPTPTPVQPIPVPTQTIPTPQVQPQPEPIQEVHQEQVEEKKEVDNFEDSFEKDFFETETTPVSIKEQPAPTSVVETTPQVEQSIQKEIPQQVVQTQPIPTPIEEHKTQIEQHVQEVVHQEVKQPTMVQAPVQETVDDFSLVEEKVEHHSSDEISLIKNGEYDYEALNEYYKAMVQEEEVEEVEQNFDRIQNNDKETSKSNVFSAEMIMNAEALKYWQDEDSKFAQAQKDFEEQRAEKQLFDQIMISAINQDATDVHFELNGNKIVIKFRILWGLQVQQEIEVPTYSRLLNYLKDIFKMKVDENREHQDGSYSYIYLDADGVQSKKRLRAVIMPTYKKYEEVGDIRNTGKVIEILVIRLLAQSTKPFHALGLEEYRETILSAIDTEGIFLISWPTGSGKTTTLASIATYIAQRDPSRKFYSVEDPVEIELSQIVQLELTDKFKIINAIKGLLRWDPDIMMIWEIREILNMEFAIDAANTGHIVFGTIHTKNAIGIPNRIKTQGANVELFMEAANLFHAQRLIPISWKNISIKELKKKMYVEKNMDYIKNWYYRDFIYGWDKLVFKEFILKNQLLRRNILGEKFYKNLKNPKLEKYKILLRIFLDGWTLKIKNEQVKFKALDERIFKMLCDFIEENIYINDIITAEDEHYIRAALGLGAEVEEVPKSKGRYPIVEILNFKDVNIKLLMERPNPEQEILNQEINFLTMFQDAFIKSVIFGKPWLLNKSDKRVLSLNIIDYIREGKQIYGLNDTIEEFYQELAKKK